MFHRVFDAADHFRRRNFTRDAHDEQTSAVDAHAIWREQQIEREVEDVDAVADASERDERTHAQHTCRKTPTDDGNDDDR